MSILTITPSGQNVSIVTINQGQQGPAGPGISITNYGNDRLITSDGTASGAYAESNLVFNGLTLSISGVPVSVSGHTHSTSDISDISGFISSGVNNYFSSLSTISNECDIEYVIIQSSGNITKLVDINNLANVISTIDGGGVLYSGC